MAKKEKSYITAYYGSEKEHGAYKEGFLQGYSMCLLEMETAIQRINIHRVEVELIAKGKPVKQVQSWKEWEERLGMSQSPSERDKGE